MAGVGERIKTRRLELGWTQDQLALKAGISKSFLSDLENGKSSVGAENLLDIARALGVSLDFLMTGRRARTSRPRFRSRRPWPGSLRKNGCRSGRPYAAGHAEADRRPPQRQEEGRPGGGGLAEVLREREGVIWRTNRADWNTPLKSPTSPPTSAWPVPPTRWRPSCATAAPASTAGWHEAGGVAGIAALEALVTRKLQMVFEEVWSDEDFDRITDEVRQGKKDFVFAAMRVRFDDADNPTYGALVQRKNVGPDAPDRYVAVIDCRGSKLARRFFTRWHEIAHRLTTDADLMSRPYRSEHDPIERLMDEIAGHVGFYGPLFDPVFQAAHGGQGTAAVQHGRGGRRAGLPRSQLPGHAQRLHPHAADAGDLPGGGAGPQGGGEAGDRGRLAPAVRLRGAACLSCGPCGSWRTRRRRARSS